MVGSIEYTFFVFAKLEVLFYQNSIRALHGYVFSQPQPTVTAENFFLTDRNRSSF